MAFECVLKIAVAPTTFRSSPTSNRSSGWNSAPRSVTSEADPTGRCSTAPYGHGSVERCDTSG